MPAIDLKALPEGRLRCRRSKGKHPMSGQLPAARPSGTRSGELHRRPRPAATVMGDYGAGGSSRSSRPGKGIRSASWGRPIRCRSIRWEFLLAHWSAATSARWCLTSSIPRSRAAFDRLLAAADVMVVNFPLKVRERLRMRYADVKHINPRLIYASMTGYGGGGPDAEQPGFDSTAFLPAPDCSTASPTKVGRPPSPCRHRATR